MSTNREPMWYCHECHAEMRPLMVPDPVCASCSGSFVEKIENPRDDPREFIGADNGDVDGLNGPGLDTFLLSLHNLLDRGLANQRPSGPEPGARFSFQMSGPGGTRQINLGGSPTTRTTAGTTGGGDRVPTMTDFLRGAPAGPGQDGRLISGQMMAQYLLALLGNRDPFANALAGMGTAGNGRMGDYVYNQEALDEIITQLMENSNAHRPVPATDDIMNKLPREVLTVGSATLSKDCAVCKDQFKVETEDPDEQVIITLPCKHPFHQPCIIPWLKSSGTCPVCRFALVAQPSQPTSPGPQSASSSVNPPSSPSPLRNPASSTSSPPRTPGSSSGGSNGGFMQALFSHLTGTGHGAGSSPSLSPSSSDRSAGGRRSSYSSSSSTGHRRSNSDPFSRSPANRNGRRRDSNRDHLPGGWGDDLD